MTTLQQTTLDGNEHETFAEMRERLAHDLPNEEQAKLAEVRQCRLERMYEMTAEFMGGIYEGDILFLA